MSLKWFWIGGFFAGVSVSFALFSVYFAWVAISGGTCA